MEEAINERLLEKLKSFLAPSMADRTETLRMVVGRLYSRAASHGRLLKYLWRCVHMSFMAFLILFFFS